LPDRQAIAPAYGALGSTPEAIAEMKKIFASELQKLTEPAGSGKRSTNR